MGITYDDLQKLSFNEVRGTGLAAVCPTIDEGSTDLQAIKPGTYKLQVVMMNRFLEMHCAAQQPNG